MGKQSFIKGAPKRALVLLICAALARPSAGLEMARDSRATDLLPAMNPLLLSEALSARSLIERTRPPVSFHAPWISHLRPTDRDESGLLRGKPESEEDYRRLSLLVAPLNLGMPENQRQWGAALASHMRQLMSTELALFGIAVFWGTAVMGSTWDYLHRRRSTSPLADLFMGSVDPSRLSILISLNFLRVFVLSDWITAVIKILGNASDPLAEASSVLVEQVTTWLIAIGALTYLTRTQPSADSTVQARGLGGERLSDIREGSVGGIVEWQDTPWWLTFLGPFLPLPVYVLPVTKRKAMFCSA